MLDKLLDHILESRLFAPFISFVGVAVMLLWRKEPNRRRIAVAVLAAPTFTFLVVPIATAWIRNTPDLAWLPRDGSVEGLLGFVAGITALNLVALVVRGGDQAETIVANRIGGK